MSNPTEKSYSSDQRISSQKEDRFNRWPFAQRVAETIAHRQDVSSLVIGIYGAWGDGKTSVLRMMEDAFGSTGEIVVVNFNPWLFQSESQLVASFFNSLADALGKKLSTKAEEIGKALNRYGSLLSVASFSVGVVVSINPGDSAQKLGRALSTVELDQLKTRIEKILRESGKRVVVLIDDIDRLDRQEIQAIFKLVKLSAGFEYISYVLAFDDAVVADALGERYGAGGAEAGRNFLEKIIQVPLHLPPADRLSLRQLAFEGVDFALNPLELKLPEDDVQAFGRHFVDGLEIRLETPRQAKRYANALAFAMPILKGEVHPVDQMLVEGVRVFYPALYNVIRENPDICIGSSRERGDGRRERSKEVLDAGLRGLGSAEQEAAKDLLQVLFPRLKGVYGNTHYGTDWDERWQREQRICSDSYFARYFQYGVPVRDISDHKLNELLDAALLSAEGVGEFLKKFAEQHASPRLVEKLRLREKTIDPVRAMNLALAIASNGILFPDEKGVLSVFLSTRSQAGILVTNLVRYTTAGKEREELAKRIIETADPIPFAVECFRWLRTGKREAERTLSSQCEEELGQILARRIRDAASARPPYDDWPADASSLLWIWKEYGGDQAKSYLEKRLSAHPAEVSQFLLIFVPTAWGLESGLSHKADFSQSAYASVSDLLSSEMVFQQLRAIYGESLDKAEFYPSRELSLEERIAHQFAFLHLKAHSAEEPTPAEPEQRTDNDRPPDVNG
jgi:hypothetical protein